MRIVAVCGSGVGTSAILKLNAERALDRLLLEADVVASDLASLPETAASAQVILVSPELVDRLPATNADVVVVRDYLDVAELAESLEAAIG